MATLLGTSFTDEEVVAQSDVNLAGTTVETLIVEFDQAKYEDLLSSGSLSPKAMRKIRKVSREIKTSDRPKSPKGGPAIESDGSDSVSSKCKGLVSTEPVKQAEELTPVPAQQVSGRKRPVEALNSADADIDTAKALRQAKKNAARRKRRSLRRAQLRESRSSNQRDPELRVPTTERQPHVECGPQWRVVQTKRSSQSCVSPTKRSSQSCVSTTKRGPQVGVSTTKRGPQVGVSTTKRGPQVGVSSTKRGPQGRVSSIKRGPQGRVSSIKRGPQARVDQMEHDPRVYTTRRDEIRRVRKNERGFNVHVNPEPTQSNDERTVPGQTAHPADNIPQVSDLRELLSRERSTPQVAHSCQCERLIATVLSECQCCAPPPRRSVFDRLTNAAPLKKRRRFHKRKTSETEYPEVTINMVGRGGSSASSSDESGTNRSPSVREIKDKFEGIYQHTRT